MGPAAFHVGHRPGSDSPPAAPASCDQTGFLRSGQTLAYRTSRVPPVARGSIDRFAPVRASRQDGEAMTLMLSRRVMLSCGGMLLCSAALATPEDTPKPASLAGQLLVATQQMGDPRFRHAVILMVKHDKTGALGIVINRPIEELTLAKLMQGLGQ